MANLIRRHNDGERAQALARERERDIFDPMRLFRDFMRWDPFREMQALWGPHGSERGLAPAFEVAEHKDRIVVKADLPGIKESDLDVKLTGNRLTITGKRESEHEDEADTYYACERSYGQFTRTFTLPPEEVDLEHITAELKDGVLTIAMPKKQTAEAKKIEIKGGEKAEQKS
jgi:HSP20 family protein